MDGHVKKQWDLLVNLVEGQGTDELRNHVAECERCQAAVRDLVAIKAGFHYQVFEPPRSLIESAIGIARHQVQRLAILTPRLSNFGARSDRAPAQVLFGQDDLQVRAMYAPTPAGWEVLLSLDGKKGTVYFNGDRFESDSQGRVSIPVPTLEEAELLLEIGGGQYLIPNPIEAGIDGS